MDRRFFWTKVWGAPDVPAHDALAFSHESTRDSVLASILPGDIVVYLTSDATEADSMIRGRVAGAVEIADPPEPVLVEPLRVDRIRQEHFRKDGRFRWPFGITVSRTWKVIDQEANYALVPDHGLMGMQGAATIHPLRSDEIQRFLRLRVVEQIEGEVADRQPFFTSLRRPWHQKTGPRAGSEIQPGSQLYVAVIADDNGTTFKVGSGKTDDRLAELNRYRRPSQGETLWSVFQTWDFNTVAAARAAEDHLLLRANSMGFRSKDQSEFLVKIGTAQLADLFSEAVERGCIEDASAIDELARQVLKPKMRAAD